jgi:hypothetical protein
LKEEQFENPMTDDEKNVVKGMNRLICDLTRLKAVYEAVLNVRVANWQAEVEAANASVPLQALAHNVENARQGIDLLIEQNSLSLVPSRLSKDGLAN